MKKETIIKLILDNNDTALSIRLKDYQRKEINELSSDEETFPLLLAIKYGFAYHFLFNEEVLAKLDVNMTNKHGTTALMELAKYGNNQELKTLLKAGADWTMKDKEGKTAEDYAEYYQDNINEDTWVLFTLEHAEEIANSK